MNTRLRLSFHGNAGHERLRASKRSLLKNQLILGLTGFLDLIDRSAQLDGSVGEAIGGLIRLMGGLLGPLDESELEEDGRD